MEKHTIQRTGKAPLEFTGKQVAQSSGKWAAGREQNRWHDITVYQTAGGKYVAHIEYHTLWEGELGHSEAEVCDAESVSYYLQDTIPALHVQGFPDKPEYAERQANLEKSNG